MFVLSFLCYYLAPVVSLTCTSYSAAAQRKHLALGKTSMADRLNSKGKYFYFPLLFNFTLFYASIRLISQVAQKMVYFLNSKSLFKSYKPSMLQ
jgi:hypothetical protein